MSEQSQEGNSNRIISLFGSENKRSEVWKYFGFMWSNNVQLDPHYHCILCYKEGKLPVK